MTNFLINRTDAIGDTLLSTPLAKFIKDKVPDAHITFLVSKRSGDFIKLCQGVDDVIVYDEKELGFFGRFIFLHKLFRDREISFYFHLGGSFLPTFVAFLKKVAFRGGLRSKVFSFLFLNKGMRQSRSIVTMHESEYNMNLAASLGFFYQASQKENYRPLLNLDEAKLLEKSKTFPIDLEKQNILIHPGMSGHTLNWSSRNYGRLICRLEERFSDRFNYIISFTPSDEPYLEGLRSYLESDKEAEEKVTFFNGAENGLIDYSYLVKSVDLFIGPSTGTSHIANAVRTPQVALYSPIKAQSVMRWGPYSRNEDVQVLVPDVVCGESRVCAGAACPYYECMAKIEVEDVVKACIEILDRKR